jgi:hypothetical protein
MASLRDAILFGGEQGIYLLICTPRPVITIVIKKNTAAPPTKESCGIDLQIL